MNSLISCEAGRWLASASAMNSSRKSGSNFIVNTAILIALPPRVMTLYTPIQVVLGQASAAIAKASTCYRQKAHRMKAMRRFSSLSFSVSS
jgi:hypothetical protein